MTNRMTAGQIAYNAYREHTGGISLISGQTIPVWENVIPCIRESWEAAGVAILARWQARERQLIDANNAEVVRRRAFEREVNQSFTEQRLLRNECIRLREVVSTLSTFIEECHAGGDEPIPEDIMAAIDAVFPPEARTDTERIDKLAELTSGDGLDLVIDREDGMYTISGIETGRGIDLRSALDDLLRQERGETVIIADPVSHEPHHHAPEPRP